MKGYYLDDATAIAEDAPYTFYIPSQSIIDQLEVGNLVKLIFIFESHEPEMPLAERMWVKITARNGSQFIGELNNLPLHIGVLSWGYEIAFQAKHIINSDVENEEENLVDKYTHRCLVTNEILQNKRKVKYLYREESLDERQPGIVDSGWRIMAGDEDQDYTNDPANAQFVSLGVVLNIDDTIIPVLDKPVGSAFEWDNFTERFVRL